MLATTCLRFGQRRDWQATDVYRTVLQARSLASSIALRQRRLALATAEGRKLLSSVSDARKRLATTILASNASSIGEIDAVRKAQRDKDLQELALADFIDRLDAANPNTAPAPRLSTLLPPNVVIIDFYQCPMILDDPGHGKYPFQREPHYQAFVSRKDESGFTVDWIELGPAKPISEAVLAWQQRFLQDDWTSPRTLAASNQLRRLLWDKVAHAIGEDKTIIIVPDRELCFVPWNALPGSKPGSYLVEEHAITTANSLQQVASVLRDDAPVGGDLVLVGGVDYDGRDNLPGREQLNRKGLKLAKRSRSPFDQPTARMQWSALQGTPEGS